MRIATDKVIANSRNSRPTRPPIRRIGTNTAIRERLIDRTVNPTSAAPRSAASRRLMPASIWREECSMTQGPETTTNPGEIADTIKDRLVTGATNQEHVAGVAVCGNGPAELLSWAARAV